MGDPMLRIAALHLVLLLGLPVVGGAASAATLPFTGTIEFQFGTGGSTVSLAGSGVATVNGSGGGGHLSSFAIGANAFQGTASTPIFNNSPISGYLLAGGTMTRVFTIPPMLMFTFVYPTGSFSNAAGSFAGLSGGPTGGGAMPVNGILFICLFALGGGCDNNPGSNIVIPLGVVGAGGTTVRTGVGYNATVIGAPWTRGTATVGVSTIMGFVHGPGSGTSTAAQVSGVVSLVTPVTVSINSGTLPLLPVFSRMTLRFVPEPTTMLLLGAGVIALGLMGRRMSRP